MGEEVLAVLCALLFFLALITVVGHGLWLLAAALVRAMSGQPAASAGKPCSQCGARFGVHDGRCVACGAVPTVGPGDTHREELKATARQLRRMLDQGRITQRQYDELAVHLQADLSRHGAALPQPLPLVAGADEVVEAQIVEPPPVSQRPFAQPPTAPQRRIAPPFAPTLPAAPPPAPVEPPQPTRSWADVLQSFMEESNIRWGEILAAMLIVVSAVGLVISLRATLKSIPYFPALLFTIFTVSFHGAGIYTLRRWNLHAVSRVILIISLLLVPLTFSAAVVMSGSGDEQRPVTSPLFLLAVTLGTAVFAWVTWSSSRELVGEGAWRLTVGVLGCSLSQVLIQRVRFAELGFGGLYLVTAVPLACFLVATLGQLARARGWPRLSRGRTNQIFLVLGIAIFAFLVPLALIILRAEPRWLSIARLSPILSLAAASVLALGLLVHLRTTARSLATLQTAGTAILICGGLLMLMLVYFAWPQPALLCAVGVLNALVLVGLALASRLALLHAPAIACAALAAVMGLHLAQGRFGEGDALAQQIVEASLMARTSLVLTLLAGATAAIGVWYSRRRQEESLVYLGGTGVLAIFSLAIAAVAGFVPIDGWQQDADLAGPLILLYGVAFIFAGPLTPWPAVAGIGSALAWAGLVQLTTFNRSVRGALDSLQLLPQRTIFVATLIHAVTTALVAAIAMGRRLVTPRDEFHSDLQSQRGQRLVLPLSIGAAVSLVAIVPAMLWVWDERFVWHAAYALWAAAGWAAVALAMRWKWAVIGLQAMLALAPALFLAGTWKAAVPDDWWLVPGHVQGQLILFAIGALLWSVVRRAASGQLLARELLVAPWPPLDQILLAIATVALPLVTLGWSLADLGWELGYDVSDLVELSASPLQSVAGRGFYVLAAVLLAILASLWERVSQGALVCLGVASLAAVWLAAQFWHETAGVASAARWAAGIYAIVWATPFIFRKPIRALAKRVVWLKWEKFDQQLAGWFCAQPLVLGGVPVLVLTILAVAQNVAGITPRGPAVGSVFHAMGPTASYAVPLLALVGVLLAYAVRERQAAFAMGGSAVFQLAINLAFLLHIATAKPPGSLAGIEWLQWNAVAAGAYALIWLGLRPWITPLDSPRSRSTQDVMLRVQIAVGLVLTVALVGWAALAVVDAPLVKSAAAGQLGHWLSYVAVALVMGALAWHGLKWIPSGLADVAVWLAVGLVAFVACSLDQFDLRRQWLAYHALTGGWLGIGLTATALVCLHRRVPARFNPHHLSAAVIATLVAMLAIRGNRQDPSEPWWSLAATLGPFAIVATLGIARRSQPYAYASALLAGLAAVLLLRAPSVAGLLPQALGVPPLAAVDLVAVVVLLAAGLWLAAELHFQHHRSQSLDPRFGGPRVHALILLGWLAVLVCWQLFLLVPLNWIGTIGAKIAVVADVLLIGVLIAASLWDRRGWWWPAAAFAWGIAAWTLAVNLVAESQRLAWDERFTLLGLATALHIALAGHLWSYGANLSVWGMRLGVSDPIGGLKRIERWLPVVTLLLAALVSIGQLLPALLLDRLELRAVAAWSPAIAAWGVLCLAQEKRREALQLTALLMAGLSAIYLGWAQLDPQEAEATWALSRAFRLLMVLAAVTFAYGLVLPRWLLTGGSWNAAVRKAGYVASVSALVTFVAVLVLELMLFTPGVDAPIDGVQVAAIGVVLVGLIAGLLSLALLPGRDPLTLTEDGRQWYVYAAQAIGVLLFAHLYICRPTWFDAGLRPYWPLIVMGIAFLGVGASELAQRFRIRVLAEPLGRTGALLPLLPALGWWIVGSRTDYGLLLFVVGLLYLILSVTHKSWISLIAAAVAGNGALWAMLNKSGWDFSANPQFWLIPPALSALAAAQIHRRRLDPGMLAGIRYLATIVIYLSSTSQIFITGVGNSLWPPMILASLAVAGAMLGIVLRIRAFLYLGTSFTLLALITMVWHAARAIEHVWPWWAFGIGLGIAILALFGLFEKKRAEMLALIGKLRQWEQ